MIGNELIEEALENGSIEITPFEQRLLGPASYDVTLGDEVLLFSETVKEVDPMNPPTEYSRKTLPATIPPNEVVIATTVEKLKLDEKFLAVLEGKSSLGRLGLAVHVTAGFIDPGFKGTITLELVNFSNRPILLTPGMQIGQLTFQRISGVKTDYSQTGRYQDQEGPQPSRGVTF